MTDLKREEIGDRLENLELLREMLVGEELESYESKINDLESQLEKVRQEMRHQGDEVQNTLNRKIDEVLNALQVSQLPPSTPAIAKPSLGQPPVSAPEPPSPPEPNLNDFFGQINDILGVQSPTAESQAPTPQRLTSPSAPAIAQQPQGQSPRSAPEPPSPAAIAPPPEPDFNDFFGQINSILAEPSPQSEMQAAPPPPVIPPPAPQPVEQLPAPHPQPTPEGHLTVIATEQASQIQNLHNILLDEDIARLRQINEQLDLKLRQIEDYLTTSQQPLNALLPLLTELVQLKLQTHQAPAIAQLPPAQRVLPWQLLWVLFLLVISLPLGIYGYWLWQEARREQQVAIALAATPELSLYKLEADVQGNQLYLSGKVPSEALRDRTAQIAGSTLPTLTLQNKIIVAPALLSPAEKMAVINERLNTFKGTSGINIKAQLEGDRLILQGTVLRAQDITTIITALETINGIQQIVNNIQVQAQPISVRLYFDQNSAAVKPDDIDQKLPPIKTFLQQYPTLQLRIIGYQHPTESVADIALTRAQATQILLTDLGIDRRRIVALGVNQPPPDITTTDPLWLSRTVLFEIVPPTAQ